MLIAAWSGSTERKAGLWSGGVSQRCVLRLGSPIRGPRPQAVDRSIPGMKSNPADHSTQESCFIIATASFAPYPDGGDSLRVYSTLASSNTGVERAGDENRAGGDHTVRGSGIPAVSSVELTPNNLCG